MAYWPTLVDFHGINGSVNIPNSSHGCVMGQLKAPPRNGGISSSGQVEKIYKWFKMIDGLHGHDIWLVNGS